MNRATPQGLATRISEALREFDDAPDNDARGKAYQNAACYFLSAIPGVTITAQNVLNREGNQEIDVAAVNARLLKGLHFLPSLLLAEMKGWNQPVASRDIAWFATKLRERSLNYGFLFVAAGVTGDFDRGNAGHAQLARALADGRLIIPVTRQDIESVRDARGAVRVIQRRLTEVLLGNVEL